MHLRFSISVLLFIINELRMFALLDCFTWNFVRPGAVSGRAMGLPGLWRQRPMSTSITLMSLGDTPGMRLACASVTGSMLCSFCRASVDSCCISA